MHACMKCKTVVDAQSWWPICWVEYKLKYMINENEILNIKADVLKKKRHTCTSSANKLNSEQMKARKLEIRSKSTWYIPDRFFYGSMGMQIHLPLFRLSSSSLASRWIKLTTTKSIFWNQNQLYEMWKPTVDQRCFLSFFFLFPFFLNN